jgi:hypothetical protein
MKYQQLVVNGCSYVEAYASGGGHVHLAELLAIPHAQSLGLGGSTNSRIIRTTLKHSYQQAEPTLYVVGMTFLSRMELPILDQADSFEGRWTNPQNQEFSARWHPHWTAADTDAFYELKLKSEVYSTFDRLDDLQYRILSMISNLQTRGHGVVVYQQADDLHLPYIDDANFDLLRQTPAVVGGYKWRAVPWQHELDVPAMYTVPTNNRYGEPDAAIRHRLPGAHHLLNKFLFDHIGQHQL